MEVDHSLQISCPDGLGRSTTIIMDGRQIYASSLSLEMDGESLATATIVFSGVAVEFTGDVVVVAKLKREQKWWQKIADAIKGRYQERHNGRSPSGDVRDSGEPEG